MNHDIAKGEFGIVSTRYRNDSRSALMIHQFSHHVSRHDPRHCELDTSSHVKKKDQKPLTLELTVNVKHKINNKNNEEPAYAEIKFFREPFMTSWIEALISLFQQLPSEERKVKANIHYQDMLNRKLDDKRKEPNNTEVMGMSAVSAFEAFMEDKPIKLNQDQMTSIAPQWCHVVMSSGVKSDIAQHPLNLCCAPEGLNIAMRVPEHMVAKLAEHLYPVNQRVHVTVKLQLFSGTSVLKSMSYKIKTDDMKISVNYDHPFKQPHFLFENQGVAHLQDIIGVKFQV